VTDQALGVQRTYLLLTLLSTLAASLIWGINTLFLLDAGLNNTEAFAANAFFTAGMVIFEIPTGVLADIWGRRTSYLLGAGTLLVTTLVYLAMWQIQAPLWGWAIASILVGLGFTFFSGATEAWLVDALNFTGAKDELEPVLARGQVVEGAAMLFGSAAGGFLAQLTNLGVPYVVRSALLGFTLGAALFFMRDVGFTPKRGKEPLGEVRRVFRESLDAGWRNAPVRWLMLSALMSGGVGIFAFYALQPYLLELYGDERAFGIAGLAAAIVAGTELLAGLIAPRIRHLFRRRTHALILASALAVTSLALLGFTSSFWFAIALLIVWGMTFAVTFPFRQAYLNGIIPAQQRATVLSFDNLMGSAGAVVAQPLLGRVADLRGYPAAYVVSAGIQLAALPFLLLARRENAASDWIDDSQPSQIAEPSEK
jgi:MFS family permease